MNLKKRLEHLANTDMKERAMGKTTVIAEAARERGGIVIAATHDQAKYIERNFKVVSVSMETNLDGRNGPFFMDHNAVSQMFLKAARKIEALEKENAELKLSMGNILGISMEARKSNP